VRYALNRMSLAQTGEGRSVAGYAADSTFLSVEGDEQDTTLTPTPMSASEDESSNSEDETADESVLDNVTSYRWKWTSLEEGKTVPEIMGSAFEKPDREYYLSGTGDDLSEFYKVGKTVKMRTGTEGEWTTYTGDAAEGMMGISGLYTGLFSQGYFSIKEENSGFKRSDGGTVTGYSTQKYVWAMKLQGAKMSITAWIIDSGEFKGGISRWETKSTKDGKKTSFAWDVFDLNKSIGIELP